MATTAAMLQVVVNADTSKAEKGLKNISDSTDHASTGVKGFLGNMLQMATGIGVADLAGTAFNFLRGQVVDSFQAGEQANQVMAQTIAGLKSTHDASGMAAQGVAALATKISNLSGIDDTAVQTAENMLLTFTNIGKSVFPAATQAAADMATKMNGGMIPTAQQMQQQSLLLGKALNDPLKGITALTREGVTFTDQQKKQIAQMMKAGDTAGAQKVILKELNKEFGGSAKAAGDANGGMAKLTNQFNQMKEHLGQQLIPIVTNLGNVLMTKVIPAAQQVAQHIGDFVNFLQTHQDAMDAFKAGLAAFAGVVIAALVPAFITWAGTAWAAAAGTIAATAPVILIGLAIAGLIAGIVLLIKHWGDVTKFLQNVWQNVAHKVGQGFSALGAKAHELWVSIQQHFIAGIVWFNSIPGRIRAAIQNNIVQPLEDKVKEITKNALQWGQNLIQNLINGINNKIQDVKNAASNLMSQVKNILGFHSPAKEGPGSDADTWAPNLMRMYAGGIEGGASGVRSAAAGVMSGVQSALAGGAAAHLALSASAGVSASATIAAGIMPSPGASGNHAKIFAKELVRELMTSPQASRRVSIVLDGHELGFALLPHIGQAARIATGVRTM